jgi:hypothetical protein
MLLGEPFFFLVWHRLGTKTKRTMTMRGGPAIRANALSKLKSGDGTL